MLHPSVEYRLDKGLMGLLCCDRDESFEDLARRFSTNSFVSPYLNWESDTLDLLARTSTRLRVTKIKVSPDDRYLAVEYSVADGLRQLIGIWSGGLSTKNGSLLAGLARSSSQSRLRFGTDVNGTSLLLHFVRGGSEFLIVELSYGSNLGGSDGDNASSSTQVGTKPEVSISGSHSQRCVPSLPEPNRRIYNFRAFRQAIDDAYLIRGGHILAAVSGKIVRVRLTSLIDQHKGSETLRFIGRELNGPVFSAELGLIYANSDNDLLSYYNIYTQSLFRLSLPQRCISQIGDYENIAKHLLQGDLHEEFPIERHLSPDGKRMAIVYSFRHNCPGMFDLEDSPIPEKSLEWMMQNIYRKPSIQSINYYTGLGGQCENGTHALKDSSTLVITRPLAAYKRTIVRLYDLTGKIAGGGCEMLCQISLQGEQIFALTAHHGLLTLRPNHVITSYSCYKVDGPSGPENSSVNKTLSLDYDRRTTLSRYSPIDGHFLGYADFEHPVLPGARLIGQDEYRLIVCCGVNGRWLRIMLAPSFKQIEFECDVESVLRRHDELARSARVTRIFPCEAAWSNVVVQFAWIVSILGC